MGSESRSRTWFPQLPIGVDQDALFPALALCRPRRQSSLGPASSLSNRARYRARARARILSYTEETGGIPKLQADLSREDRKSSTCTSTITIGEREPIPNLVSTATDQDAPFPAFALCRPRNSLPLVPLPRSPIVLVLVLGFSYYRGERAVFPNYRLILAVKIGIEHEHEHDNDWGARADPELGFHSYRSGRSIPSLCALPAKATVFPWSRFLALQSCSLSCSCSSSDSLIPRRRAVFPNYRLILAVKIGIEHEHDNDWEREPTPNLVSTATDRRRSGRSLPSPCALPAKATVFPWSRFLALQSCSLSCSCSSSDSLIPRRRGCIPKLQADLSREDRKSSTCTSTITIGEREPIPNLVSTATDRRRSGRSLPSLCALPAKATVFPWSRFLALQSCSLSCSCSSSDSLIPEENGLYSQITG